MSESVLTLSDIPNVLKIAEKAARKAGLYLLQQLGHTITTYKKSPLDDVLDADLEAERIILTTLRDETPSIGLLSEEAGQEGRQDQFWIIDPLDGSTNFQHGNPAFAIAIALTIDTRTVASIIYLPTSDEMFTATEKQGAYLNRQPIRVSETENLTKAIIHMGDFTKEDNALATSEGLKDFSALITQVRRVRMLGTAAVDLAYVSCGRADALLNHAMHAWDIEAGKLLLTEAGGKVTTIERASKPLSIYSNDTIHHTLKSLFNPPM